MISVCMATYNGESYIEEQISSILPQLSSNDELIISDDGSKDNTIDIIKKINDNRIKIHINEGRHGYVHNFGNALSKAKGDYIFLSDQDDIWMPNKIEKCCSQLKEHIIVNHNSMLVDKFGNSLGVDFYSIVKPKSGYWQTIWQNRYCGANMAFRKELLNYALPFPGNTPAHDIWIALIAEKHGKTIFDDTCLIKYRRHSNNTSSCTEKSKLSLKRKIEYRLILFWNSLFR